MNLGTSLHWVSTKMSKKTCIIQDDVKVSYSELWKNIELLAKAFLKMGLRQDDKIVIFLPNCKEFIYSFYALSRINVISVPLNPQLTSFELKKIFNDCKPKGIITTSSLYDKKVASILSKDRLIIAIDKQINELLSIGEEGPLPNFNTSNNQVATINYTYRGIGKPLGAMLTHGNYHHGAIGYVRLTEVVTAQRFLLVIPMSHIFTLVSCVIVPLLRGATVVITRSFIPSHILKVIEAHKIDFIIAVPTVYISLLKNYSKGRFDISSLKYGITGGSYMPLAIHKAIKEEMGIELLQGYGLTETMPIACNPKSRNRPDSLGVSGHEVEIKIADGEILIGGPTVMQGYYNKNGENQKFLRKGWFYTGDNGQLDEDGYIYFNGLKKDIAKIGGNNVDLKEVKDVMSSFPGAKDIELDVITDDLWGHRINARLEIASRKEVTEKDVKSFCKERLAIYKIPRKISVKIK
ncbi:MAG: AMP-binding protein [Candidatus Gorgyraea atricola]|nr:AMP-binding protein [Candidatus Gorgyraea atricola]